VADRPARTRADIIAALSRVTAIDPSLIGDTIAMLEGDEATIVDLRTRVHHLNEDLLDARFRLRLRS
jgi:hypothetical protein